MQTRQKIILTPGDNSLSGKINQDAEHVHVLLDTTLAGFTVVLPDTTGSMQRELIFKNIGTNNATLSAITGQYLDYSTTHIVRPLDLVGVWSDLVKTWWLLDANSVSFTNTMSVTSATYTILAYDEVLFINTTTTNIAVIMPNGEDGRHLKICNTGAVGNTVTLTPYSTQKVYGASTETIYDGEVFDLHYNSVDGWW